ncbi:hypothetical protein Bca4012_020489 [Brassica carinata]
MDQQRTRETTSWRTDRGLDGSRAGTDRTGTGRESCFGSGGRELERFVIWNRLLTGNLNTGWRSDLEQQQVVD